MLSVLCARLGNSGGAFPLVTLLGSLSNHAQINIQSKHTHIYAHTYMHHSGVNSGWLEWMHVVTDGSEPQAVAGRGGGQDPW